MKTPQEEADSPSRNGKGEVVKTSVTINIRSEISYPCPMCGLNYFRKKDVVYHLKYRCDGYIPDTKAKHKFKFLKPL